MKRSLWLKGIFSLLIALWSGYSLRPLRSRPFDDFIQHRARAEAEGFQILLRRAQEEVAVGHDSTLYLALQRLAQEEEVDLAKFFPDIRLGDLKNVERRNGLLLRTLLKECQSSLPRGLDLAGGVSFVLEIDEQAHSSGVRTEMPLAKAIEIMSRRIDGLGVTEPILRARGERQIEIQLPGISTKDNPEVIDVLKKPAKLEFRLVHPQQHPTSFSDTPPLGYELLALEREDHKTGQIQKLPYFIKRVPEMTGKSVQSAQVMTNAYGGYEISLSMTAEGRERFAEVTRRHVGHQLAIVLDGKPYSAPVIRQEIEGGQASISGDFSQREAFELSNVLNNPLEFAMHVVELNEIRPSLADDARSNSIRASLVGIGIVILFMTIYYRFAGFIAVLALGINALLVLGIMAHIGATLTLPGIAALILTIGMGVDANILILERIREELRRGKQALQALQEGYRRVLTSILDSNLTSLLTATILIWLGTGPVRGFGVILAIGFFATMFCALFSSRFLMELGIAAGWKQLVPPAWIPATSWDFLRLRKPAYILSIALLLAGSFAMLLRGGHAYGIDFRGGDEVLLQFGQKLSLREIQSVADSEKLGEVIPTYQSAIGEATEVLRIQTEVGQGRPIVQALQNQYPDAQLSLIRESSIGASVSQSLRWNALLSVALALVGILIYIAFRFEMGYGIGAVLSTFHDAWITIGLYVLLGRQFSAPMIAAILMTIGYTINDKIIIFDRIREELRLNPFLSLYEVINLAINRTLSRTLLTSATTLLSSLTLLCFGLGVVRDLALIFSLGIIVGTFSSIFTATPILYGWHRGDRRHVETHELLPNKSKMEVDPCPERSDGQ
ncbi:MAG: protein translocase subunit SecD [Puniceicoccales bacterium]|jgi:SecD/SecF fusion protein|nr:protein translocase subunit SecD [Puniceicoccales bacterium]